VTLRAHALFTRAKHILSNNNNNNDDDETKIKKNPSKRYYTIYTFSGPTCYFRLIVLWPNLRRFLAACVGSPSDVYNMGRWQIKSVARILLTNIGGQRWWWWCDFQTKIIVVEIVSNVRHLAARVPRRNITRKSYLCTYVYVVNKGLEVRFAVVFREKKTGRSVFVSIWFTSQ